MTFKANVNRGPTYLHNVNEELDDDATDPNIDLFPCFFFNKIIVKILFFFWQGEEYTCNCHFILFCIRSVRFFLPTSGGFTHIVCFFSIYFLLLCLYP